MKWLGVLIAVHALLVHQAHGANKKSASSDPKVTNQVR